MKKRQWFIGSLLVSLILVGCGNQVDDATAQKYSDKATSIVTKLNAGAYTDITKQFDATMKANLSATQLAEIQPTIEKSGTFKKIEKQSVEEKDGMTTVILVAKYQNDKRVYTISYNEENQISGLYVK